MIPINHKDQEKGGVSGSRDSGEHRDGDEQGHPSKVSKSHVNIGAAGRGQVFSACGLIPLVFVHMLVWMASGFFLLLFFLVGFWRSDAHWLCWGM